MSATEKDQSPPPSLAERLPVIMSIYGRILAGVMMLLGLYQWAIIVGVAAGPGGMFETMSTPWKLATMHLAVVDLVAAVGLWQRVAWGNVVWIYAALAQIAMHTVFVGTYGSEIPIVAFHTVTLVVYLALYMIERRAEGR
ncbi:DUF6163 family protein [Bauldia sp.]|uniref:DUF6163 family protein n=1 Tax=Bauldia sp. TaxID=2575872 RepID=UPI0025C01420|nr:DUF6163 family protein [Bauldia sp.]